MAKLSKIIRSQNPTKYPVQHRNRCRRCGRPRAYMRLFALCRICFRDMALKGELPGVRKSSW